MKVARKPVAVSSRNAQREKLIEEFARLDREIQDYLPRIKRHEKLRSLILSWNPNLAENAELLVPGATIDILISARDSIRTVTPEGKKKLFKLWGQAQFISNCSMYLKSLPDPEDPDGMYTKKQFIGPRHLHVLTRARAAQSPAA